MAHIRGFPAIARTDARVLILGTMPSRESLRQQQYYAHPRNALWPILCELFGIEASDYEARRQAVVEHGIAIWDVLKACFRSTSLDSDILADSAVPNDFAGFLSEHPGIRQVFFNGATAEKLFKKHVWADLPPIRETLTFTRLPSTSPAMAALSFEQKFVAWACVKEALSQG